MLGKVEAKAKQLQTARERCVSGKRYHPENLCRSLRRRGIPHSRFKTAQDRQGCLCSEGISQTEEAKLCFSPPASPPSTTPLFIKGISTDSFRRENGC